MYTINCKGKLFSLDVPRVMGIINLTPDSFYEGSRHMPVESALRKAGEMLEQGAAFLDLGAYSSRPDAEDISMEEESSRLLPVLKAIAKRFPEAIISVDTFRAEVARRAVAEGAAMINDISGGQLDEKMFETAASLQVPYIIMHMRGTPQTMARENQYQDICGDLVTYFSKAIRRLRSLGVNDLIIDPGFGFAKHPAQSFELLRRLDELRVLDCPLLAGLSRKSMLYRTLGTGPEETLTATNVAGMIALERGARILRVHDVKEALETVKIFSTLQHN
ncbi:dihydropteroate synthase [Anseongella ginsenosidimutans]|uniref:dihydropteroate synthase n=1 Tax=Anseongella ginsenosidimutans TaxID=496056 RepID=A0A4R3KXA0_9SPHI|nr:dihydropteroate synthase [Anseongella ginsenosidimutans]QEC50917.1 dihydropteroate synthase [Anseongella ginsenosidimutans]TCS90449.1 dihydropteroate synthase [Anseongella ginsenosidimutans]